MMSIYSALNVAPAFAACPRVCTDDGPGALPSPLRPFLDRRQLTATGIAVEDGIAPQMPCVERVQGRRCWRRQWIFPNWRLIEG